MVLPWGIMGHPNEQRVSLPSQRRRRPVGPAGAQAGRRVLPRRGARAGARQAGRRARRHSGRRNGAVPGRAGVRHRDRHGFAVDGVAFPGDQRDRRRAAYEPGTRALEQGCRGGCAAGGGGLLRSGAGPGYGPARLQAGARAAAAVPAHGRGGGAGGEQQRVGAADRAVGDRTGQGGHRLARRGHRDRRRLPHPGRDAAERRDAGRGGHDEPDLRVRLRGGDHGEHRGHPVGARQQLQGHGVHARAHDGGAGGAGPAARRAGAARPRQRVPAGHDAVRAGARANAAGERGSRRFDVLLFRGQAAWAGLRRASSSATGASWGWRRATHWRGQCA